jgi:Tfp pilus assembly protein FimT
MVELVTVIVIIGILTVIAFPRVDVFHLLKFQGAGKKVLSDIRYAQSYAVLNRSYAGIQFLPGSNAYWVYFCNNTNNINCVPVASSANWPPLQDPLSHANMGVNYMNDAQYKGITIASASFGSSNMLVFNTDGAPVDAVSNVVLTGSGNVVLSYSGETINVNVAAKSGKVYVSKSF